MSTKKKQLVKMRESLKKNGETFHHKMFYRKGTISINEGFEILNGHINFHCHIYKDNPMFVGNIEIRYSKRIKVFFEKGIKCVSCGIEGKYFAIERTYESPNIYFFNLYAKNKSGSEVLMTVDHIIPVSRRGPNTLENLQPMCSPCNNKKGCHHDK